MAWGMDVCRNWTVPAYCCGNGREGRCKWCWLTGYIFDTFNELIQTFHKEGLTCVTAAVL